MFFGGGRDDDRGGGNPIALLATIILAPIAAMLIQAAISRSREFDADAGGAAIAGSPTGWSARCRKIEARVARRAARRQPGDGAHVHHQAVLGRRADRRSSARIRRPSSASQRCSTLRAANVAQADACAAQPYLPLQRAALSRTVRRHAATCWRIGSEVAASAASASAGVRLAPFDGQTEARRARRRPRHLAQQDRRNRRSASSIARSRKRAAASTRC